MEIFPDKVGIGSREVVVTISVAVVVVVTTTGAIVVA
jgi:hypothetical protein